MAKHPPAQASKRLHPMAIRLDDEMLAELREIARNETRPVANLCVQLLKEAIAERRRKTMQT
jgi:hypothetical protein